MKKELIIIVDDDKQIRNLLSDFLIQHNYHVMTVSCGNELIRLWKQEQSIALIILDIMLPDLDGFELCRRIRIQSTIPILMLTAVDNSVDRIVGLEIGADDYLTKPFHPRELLARMKAILRRTENQLISNETKKVRLQFDGWIFLRMA